MFLRVVSAVLLLGVSCSSAGFTEEHWTVYRTLMDEADYGFEQASALGVPSTRFLRTTHLASLLTPDKPSPWMDVHEQMFRDEVRRSQVVSDGIQWKIDGIRQRDNDTQHTLRGIVYIPTPLALVSMSWTGWFAWSDPTWSDSDSILFGLVLCAFANAFVLHRECCLEH